MGKKPRDIRIEKYSRSAEVTHRIEAVVELLMKQKDPTDLIKLPQRLKKSLNMNMQELVQLANEPAFDESLAKHTVLIFKLSLPQLFRKLRDTSFQDGLLGHQATRLVFDLLRLLDTKKEDDEAFERLSEEEIQFELRDIERRLLDAETLRPEVRDVILDEDRSGISRQEEKEAGSAPTEEIQGAGTGEGEVPSESEEAPSGI